MQFTFRLLLMMTISMLLAFRSANNPLSEDKIDIPWSVERPLVFADFSGTPDRDGLAALTSSAIEVNYAFRQHQLNTIVEAKFFPENSWMRKNARTAHILQHEQLHFDITEWHARQLRKTLSSMEFANTDEKKLKTIIQKHLYNWQQAQATYDSETRHGLDTVAQLKWKQYITKSLSETMEYAGNSTKNKPVD